ncbi:MAG: RNA polymerase sigma factor [Bacteroidales bacterium]|nr:RNA polymerase sigma factor [Bacteroidales bacterium]
MDNLTDSYIIEQITAGNKVLFAQLIDRYNTMAYTLAFRILNNHEDAEEIVQDAFVRVYENLGKFRQKSKFSTWLYRIVYNVAISHTRKRKPAMQDITAVIRSDEDNTQSGDLLYGFTEEEAREFIRKTLAALPEDERTIITLYYLNESGTDEIHEITGLSKANIKVKLFRARKKMQEHIKRISETAAICSINIY